MNQERFHNQLALRLGYDRIVNNKRISIKVDYKNPADPWIIIQLPDGIIEGFYASEDPKVVIARFTKANIVGTDIMKRDIEEIIYSTHQSYMICQNDNIPIYTSNEDTAVRLHI